MADLRLDPTTGIWVAVARDRLNRPQEFVPIETVRQQLICPFCRGNEDETPGGIATYDADGRLIDEPVEDLNWSCRIVPNKYPSLVQPAEAKSCAGPYDHTTTDGVQEVVIPTSRHVASISDLTDDELTICLAACQDRLRQLRQQPNIEHVMLFLNSRSAAGASLEHIHFQIMASPLVSPFLIDRHRRHLENVKKNGTSLLSSLLQWELEQRVRVLSETENFVMFCPYASKFSFQVWIVPKDQYLKFHYDKIDFNAELVRLCKRYTEALEKIIEKASYNWLLNLAPNEHAEDEHWFIEIFPRLNRTAGFELGTGIWVNPVPPETAAKRLANELSSLSSSS